MLNLIPKAILLNKFSRRKDGQSAVELAIFGSILMFVVAMIFRQGLNGGNFMNTQLKATRYAMSKSFETSLDAKPGRNNASTLIIEDRLGGDFTNKFGTRDRSPLIAGGSGTFTNQLFYPTDKGDCGDDNWKVPATGIKACDVDVLPRYDVWINGQKFSFLTANFRIIDIPAVQGTLANCTDAHPGETHCWNPGCSIAGGCVTLYRQVDNYSGSEFVAGLAAGDNAFDPNFKKEYVLGAMRAANDGIDMKFMWQWKAIDAVGELSTDDSLDVDGDFYEERILDSTVAADGRTEKVLVIDSQAGDLDFSLDGRRPGIKSGLLDDSQMFSFTRNGTVYRIEEGKLLNPRNDQYIRSVNINDHVDVVQRVIQLSNNTGRFCNGNTPQPLVDGEFNPVEACNNCFNASNIDKTCLDGGSLKLFVRSRIINKGGRSWFTQTEEMP